MNNLTQLQAISLGHRPQRRQAFALLGSGASYTIGSAASTINALAANTGAVSVTGNTITVGSVTDPVSKTATTGITTTGGTALFSDTSITLGAQVTAASLQLANATKGTTIAFGGSTPAASGLSISSIPSTVNTGTIIIGRDDAEASGLITVAGNITIPTNTVAASSMRRAKP